MVVVRLFVMVWYLEGGLYLLQLHAWQHTKIFPWSLVSILLCYVVSFIQSVAIVALALIYRLLTHQSISYLNFFSRGILFSSFAYCCLSFFSVTGYSNENINASRVTKRILHTRYSTGKPHDDLAFLELKEPIALGSRTIQLCLPEKDFSENILMKFGKEGVVVGGAEKPSYLSLDVCHSKLNLSFSLTNKMFCMEEREPDATRIRSQYKKKECDLTSGSPVATVEGNTAFLTGLFLSQNDCRQGLVFTKISRYLPWIRKLLLSSEAVQTWHVQAEA